MTGQEKASSSSFRDLEQQGWTSKASEYGAWIGGITSGAIEAVLNAAGVVKGTRLLDVACGPGYGAGRAAARGANAIGLDFAPTMVSQARQRFPKAEFFEGDGEELTFPDDSFDAVICTFGLLHMAKPDRAIAEAYRVLRSGGRYAFTVWSTPDRHQFFDLVLGAIKAHGRMDVPLPPAPPLFRFSDPDESRKALTAAGFEVVKVEEIPLTWGCETTHAAVDMIYKSTVRTAMLLENQTAEARERIHQAIIDGAARFQEEWRIPTGLPGGARDGAET